MIVVKIELWPGGDETRSEELGRMLVANDGTGSHTRGHYDAKVQIYFDAVQV